MTAAVLYIPDLADLLNLSPSTLYKTHADRVRNGYLPAPLPGSRPTWSRAQVEAFLKGERPEILTKAKPGRPAKDAPRAVSRLSLITRD